MFVFEESAWWCGLWLAYIYHDYRSLVMRGGNIEVVFDELHYNPITWADKKAQGWNKAGAYI